MCVGACNYACRCVCACVRACRHVCRWVKVGVGVYLVNLYTVSPRIIILILMPRSLKRRSIFPK